MNNFLILGLPRSRTAWLANFMTSDGIHCSHEGLNGCRTLEEYRDKFKPNSGDSSTGLAYFNFESLFKDFKIVIIESDLETSIEFTKKYFEINVTDEMTSLKKRLESIDGLHIQFDEINDNLKTIWEYITDKPFNSERAEMLKDFNVQVMNIYNFDADACMELMANYNVCIS